MRRRFLLTAVLATAALATPYALQSKPAAGVNLAALNAAVAAPTRSEANRARDKHRNPAATLAFFGVKPTHHVVELWPGGGWYTEILAPYLAANGKLTVAAPVGRGSDNIAKKLDADAATYGKVLRANFPAMMPGSKPVAPGTADVVLTFRNVHNWRMGSGNNQTDYSEAAFREIYAMLKPGGVLGIEDHRLPENADPAKEKSSGYIKVSTVKALAKAAGFQFVGESQVNANPRDTKDYPKGVWTLPPNFAEGDTDRAKFAAIGESDRMTLKFVKPRR